jgi:hypothetical protein
MIVVPATRSHAEQLLTNLGGTRQQVADNLAADGSLGQPQLCNACPVAVYLLKHLDGAVEVLVSDALINITYVGGGDEDVKTPWPVAQFVLSFDGGGFPNLIAGGAA